MSPGRANRRAREPDEGRRVRLALAGTVAVLVLIASAISVDHGVGAHLAALLGAVVHVASAFAGGLAILRVPRAAPREPVELFTSATALGFAVIALLTLAAAAAGFAHPAAPWLIDGLLLLLGARHARRALERLADGRRRLDVSVVTGSHLVLVASAALMALPFLVPPLAPLVPGLGADALALPSQVARTGALVEVLEAMPDRHATPTSGLLLHGWLAGGAAGARLHVLAIVALLAAGVGSHAARHLGGRAAAWAVLALLASPALLRMSADQPSAAWMTVFAFLAYREIADWSARPTGGKIALASIFGGVGAAEGPPGVVALAALLLFLFLYEALVDRESVVRLTAGLAGMIAIAAVAAAPFVALAASSAPDGAVASLVQRAGARSGAPTAGALDEGTPASVAPGGAGVLGVRGAPSAPGVPTALERDSATGAAAAVRSLARSILGAGSIALVIVGFTPLVRKPEEGTRHALLATALLAGSSLLPHPWGTGWILVGPLALLVGGCASSVVSDGTRAARVLRMAMILATPMALSHLLVAVPPLVPGASVALGTSSGADFLDRHLPDRDLVRVLRLRSDLPEDGVLFLGTLTIARYETTVRTRLPSGPVETWPAGLAAVDHATAPDALDLGKLELIVRADQRGRYALYRIEGPR